MKTIIIYTVYWFFELIKYLILARCIMSWIPSLTRNPIGKLVYSLTEPILSPMRKLVSKLSGNGRSMMIDFSPILAFILLWFLQSFFVSLVNML